ncbi:hypothetical protein F2Q69_00042525 [Brassica cretica]|uniref:Replication protein A 70 kDa DNA-binding subunit B/D first OB fold domain-containing protein n=1 Tax=Brassica cretica TaxID=69181 RepID=A0A8S9NC68_BRACR|nr:hypothetical protein F2Q69_00042525 [Brassica cretica]
MTQGDGDGDPESANKEKAIGEIGSDSHDVREQSREQVLQDTLVGTAENRDAISYSSVLLEDFVSDLKLFKSMWKVRVKVIRLWKQYSCALGETMEMVLADSKGDMIHGTVKKELVSQFVILISQDPVKYESINDGSLNTDYLVDVIGQIVEVSHVKVVSVNGKDTQKLSLELRNQDDDRLPMVLWGKFATDVNDAIQLRGMLFLL